MLRIDDLTVRYGAAVALDGVSLEVGAGEMVALVGPNGAGQVNIGTGGTLTTNVNANVFTIGSGNPTGSTITDGTVENFGSTLSGRRG